MVAHPLLTNKWNFINIVVDKDKRNDVHICKKFIFFNQRFNLVFLVTCCPLSVHLSVYLLVSLSLNFSHFSRTNGSDLTKLYIKSFV